MSGVSGQCFFMRYDYEMFVSIRQNTVLSISFEVDVPTGKVGSSLLFEHQRRELPRGLWGHAPPKHFEI